MEYAFSSHVAQKALTNAYGSQSVTSTTNGALAVPNTCYLYRLQGNLENIVGASSVTWFIALSATGDIPITNEITVSILDHDADGSGTVNALIDTAFAVTPSATPGTLYVWAKLDAGTADARFRLIWGE